MSRRSLTKAEKAAMIEAQQGLCGCGCGQPVTMETGEGEHWITVFCGNTDKPDSVWRKDCHKPKTKRDAKAHAKIRRLIKKQQGTWRPTRKRIRSRGFDKSLRKKMNGDVVRVDG